MKCPVCLQPDLVMAERQGIEIDYCPQCRGVWLDRGELDKIIERSAAQPSASQAPPQQQSGYPPQQQSGYAPQPGYDRDYREHKKYDKDYHGGYGHKKKRRGLLGDIFDFD
ncbi:zf-TFIIB domain-containing protein [Longimicrobium sp.]|uniref:TFIIB-type zinc ribbon-containing protein n=1 Tax=Longimicrobium sp. TaxID=2029185 RepID=UPI003B3B9A54